MDLFAANNLDFPVLFSEIQERIEEIDPIRYGSTRNYLNGAVSRLSPYISRGVISTQQVFNALLDKGYSPGQMGKFMQELAWRDYWQQVWVAKGFAINEDVKHSQGLVSNQLIATAVVEGETTISAIDQAILQLYETGYMHNHLRMYVASVACNAAQSHWRLPAKWMYYHLLDADWASNALSWQWVAGSNANKKYVANQENINKYCFTEQTNTFLDVPYSELPLKEIPEVLKQTSGPELSTPLPVGEKLQIETTWPSCIYNFYNLDPTWRTSAPANRILLLEPSKFSDYPVSQKTIDFTLRLAKNNIQNVQVFVGEFDDLILQYKLQEVYYKEHPLNYNYKGQEDSREWMFQVTGYYPSFFAFWKKCKKQLPF